MNTEHLLRITVEDHGTGIPDAIREHIFEPFFTTKSAALWGGRKRGG
jgi:signal transduction histidine kinase